MGEGHLEKALSSIRWYVLGWFFLSGMLLIGGWWLADRNLNLDSNTLLAGLVVIWLIISLVMGNLIANRASSPLKALSEAILHISPSPIQIKSPQIERLRVGRELVSSLINQIYTLNTSDTSEKPDHALSIMDVQQLPVAVITIDKEANILRANPKAQGLVGGEDSIIGKNLYSIVEISFKSEDTLQSWLGQADSGSAAAQKTWHGVRIKKFDEDIQYIDIAANYIKGSGDGEFLLTLFEETEVYTKQDDALSFVALAVHELRTPLTILRGYIEVIEEELNEHPQPEMQELIRKMKVSAQNLTAFVGNILNVARIDQNQLTLKLNRENWENVLGDIISNMRLRGEVYGKKIELKIEKNLPDVGIDRISIAEVMTNLIDNAIKYSPPGKDIIKVSSKLDKEGMIETTVQDFGVGISESTMSHLFEKYARNPRNRGSIGGTGLGLFLSKSLVTAHGGNIWVRSHEGEGSTFGFTVLTYDKVADGSQSGNNTITRNAHGWIKNHSLNRK